MTSAVLSASVAGRLMFLDASDVDCELVCRQWFNGLRMNDYVNNDTIADVYILSAIRSTSTSTSTSKNTNSSRSSSGSDPSGAGPCIVSSNSSNVMFDTAPRGLDVFFSTSQLAPGQPLANVTVRTINAFSGYSSLPLGECRLFDETAEYSIVTTPPVVPMLAGHAIFSSVTYVQNYGNADIPAVAKFRAECTVANGVGILTSTNIRLSATVQFHVLPCPPGQTMRPSRLFGNSLVCGACDEGFFPLCSSATSPLHNKCIACPLGYECVSGNLTLLPGFWSSSSLLTEHTTAKCAADEAVAENAPAASLRCPKATCSNDPSQRLLNSNANGCAPGYHGPLCLACAPGYRPDRALGCVDCNETAYVYSGPFTVAVALISSGVLLLLLLCLERRKLLRTWRRYHGQSLSTSQIRGTDELVLQFIGVQVIDFIQVLTLILAMQQFDGTLLGTVGDGIRGFLISFFSPILACVFDIDEIEKFYVKIGTLVGLVVIGPIVWTAVASVSRLLSSKKSAASKSTTHPLAFEFCLVIMLLAFVFQPFVIDECLRVLTWLQLDSRHRVWFVDPMLDYCGYGAAEVRHCVPFGVALAFVFLFGIVYVVVVHRLLALSWKYQTKGANSKSPATTIIRWSASLIGQAASSSVWWWPLSIITRKYCIIAIKLLMRDKDMQFFLTALTLLGWKALAAATHINTYRAQVESVSSYIHLLNVIVSFPLLGTSSSANGARLSEFFRSKTAELEFQSTIDAILVVITLAWITLLLLRWIVAVYRLSVPQKMSTAGGKRVGALICCMCCSSFLTCGMCSCLCIICNGMDSLFSRLRKQRPAAVNSKSQQLLVNKSKIDTSDDDDDDENESSDEFQSEEGELEQPVDEIVVYDDGGHVGGADDDAPSDTSVAVKPPSRTTDETTADENGAVSSSSRRRVASNPVSPRRRRKLHLAAGNNCVEMNVLSSHAGDLQSSSSSPGGGVTVETQQALYSSNVLPSPSPAEPAPVSLTHKISPRSPRFVLPSAAAAAADQVVKDQK